MIEFKNVSFGYKERKILDGVSFQAGKGSFTGIIGRNGAGKSTLFKLFCRLLLPYEGEISIDGKNLAEFSKKGFSKTVSFMPQIVDCSFAFSVFDFVMLGRYPYMNALKIPSAKDFDAVNETLNVAGLKEFSERKITELSGGERQRVLIAQTIAQRTDIIVFDEPTSHLDIGAQYEILNILKRLNKEYKKTIIASLHDLNAAGEFCDNLVLLDEGKAAASGTPEQVLNYKDIEKAYKTAVVVKTNPMSGKPYVIPIAAIKN
jgi:iron complex transport system ATP-binding protein